MTAITPQPPSWSRNGLIAALDVGTTKICCLIARVGTGQPMRVVGLGHREARGLRAGNLVDLEAAETTIRSAVEAAEKMAGDNIRDVVVNVSSGAPRSRLVAYEVDVAGHEVADADIRRILDPGGYCDVVPDDHDLLHVIPVGYAIDGCRGVRDPRGMFGQRLGVNLHVVTVASGALRNLAACVSRGHLHIADRVVTPYASALGCLVDDETSLGVTLIDLGGGTTSVAVFFDSELVHTDTIAVGGMHVTRDIARGLSTPMAEAERIKTLFGSCMPSPSDDRHHIEVPPMGHDVGGDPTRVRRSMLVNIIRPRMEEIFEMVRARLEDAGFDRVAGRRVVITGGASQLAGAAELAGMILDKQVRAARPQRIEGLPEVAAGPAFATCAGLLHYAATRPRETPLISASSGVEPHAGRLARIGQWLRENF